MATYSVEGALCRCCAIDVEDAGGGEGERIRGEIVRVDLKESGLVGTLSVCR